MIKQSGIDEHNTFAAKAYPEPSHDVKPHVVFPLEIPERMWGNSIRALEALFLMKINHVSEMIMQRKILIF